MDNVSGETLHTCDMLGDVDATCNDEHCTFPQFLWESVRSSSLICRVSEEYSLAVLGGYSCTCSDGYSEVDGVCEDINDCEGNKCNAMCKSHP